MKTRYNKKQNPKVIIGKLWARWCDHCKNLIPVWDKMKTLIGKNKLEYMEVEETDIHIIDEYNKNNPGETFIDTARGFPTIYKIAGGKIEYYAGKREAKEMAAWALNKKIMRGGRTRKLKSKKSRVKV